MDGKKKLQLIYEFLLEKGYRESAATLRKETHVQFDDRVDSGGALLNEILDEYGAEKHATKKELDQLTDLTNGGTHSLQLKEYAQLHNAHVGNIICVTFKDDHFLSGGTDRRVTHGRLTKLEEGAAEFERVSTLTAHTGCVLDVAFHPTNGNVCVSTGMDKQGILSCLDTGDTLQTFTDYQKYVTRARFSRGGEYLAMSSYDMTVTIYRYNEGTKLYDLVRRNTYNGAVEGLAFNHAGTELVVSARDDNYLHFIDFTKEELPVAEMNMNMLGDDWVSFAAMDVSYSPNDKYVLVSTDKDRIILYSRSTGKIVRNFYGASNDTFAQPRHCWHPSGQYIFATSQDNKIWVWEVATQKVIGRLDGHKALVRDLTYSTAYDKLVSCGFDSTIRFWH